jgi:hypothetical protein
MTGRNTGSSGFEAASARGLPRAAIEDVSVLRAYGGAAAAAHGALQLGTGRLTITDVVAVPVLAMPTFPRERRSRHYATQR